MAQSHSPAMANRIELWPVEKLQPFKRNARTHSPEQISQIAASIVEFGFTNPILVDGENGIIAGHGRLAAAQELELPEVPVVVLNYLSAKQKQAYIIADNKLALNAGWDLDLLSEEMHQLKTSNFDLSLIGFSEAELDAINSGGWDSDIDEVEKTDENLDGIEAKIITRLDPTYKSEVEDAIKNYCDTHAISVEVS